MTEDIISTIAWRCDDKDCPHVWHKANYWITHDGYSVDWYSDGDHEDCNESELPSAGQETQSWRDYSAWVVEHRKDPLAEFFVKHAIKTKQRWRFRFGPSIVGPVLIEAKQGARRVPAAELPNHVRDWLTLDKDNRRLTGFASWDELRQAQPTALPNRWWTTVIDWDKPREPALIERDLVRLAQRHLRRKA